MNHYFTLLFVFILEAAGLLIHFNVSLDVGVHPPITGQFVSGTNVDWNSSFVSLFQTKHYPVTLSCLKTICDELVLAHLVPIDFTTYMFTIRFDGLTKSSSLTGQSPSLADVYPNRLLDVLDIEFIFRYFNPRFTYLELITRFVGILVIELVMVLFLGSLRRFAVRDWTIEQKVTAVLLPSLLLFNNPFYSLRYFTGGWFPQAMDYFFQITFFCLLLLVWLCLYHGLRVTKRPFCRFYLPKLLILLVPWAVLVSLASWKARMEYTDVTFHSSFELNQMKYVGALLIFFGAVYIIVFSIFLFRAFAELYSLSYYALRLKTLTSLSFLVTVVSVLTFVLRFKADLVLKGSVGTTSSMFQSTDTSNTATWSRSSADVTVFYAMLNAYLIVLAVVYSPSKDAFVDNHFKDNPSVSMMNDSDDEDGETVMYDSDAETVQLTVRR
ncbi:hypothetical protein EG68_09634 [Paragonimus skrjabini miyazakii]|uniref:Wntless-like transmembrane domain-containing protein n=1 Tax=Paragonimus skrjabini miyazakii TaxID=59628 RepID=A0A8S9YDD9_9TREM|nr:hypothetical protein EG68_09634 [Paragonimus skrjabini miyazakii]